MKQSLRICALLIALFFITSMICLQYNGPVTAEEDVQITDVQVPFEIPQAASGQVNATIHNHLNTSFDGYARFFDATGDIRTRSPIEPLIDIINFTIGPEESMIVKVDYIVNETATLGEHIATFEINVGGFSFLYEQYSITVSPVARITNIVPGSVFQQGQVGMLLVSIENQVDLTKSVRIEVFGPKFVNSSQEIDVAPGMNNIVIPVMPNVSHVYDFGMFPVNVSLYYFDKLINSQIVLVPVDISLLNKGVAVVLPVGIFLALVLFYAFRKRQRVRAATTSE